MSELAEYVRSVTERGECSCGECIDRGDRPEPEGHVVDMVFFRVAFVGTPEPSATETFHSLTTDHAGEFGACDPFDGKEHNYLELGAWIGDQGLAMQYMALGVRLGLFALLSPDTMLGPLAKGDDDLRLSLVKSGLLAVRAVRP